MIPMDAGMDAALSAGTAVCAPGMLAKAMAAGRPSGEAGRTASPGPASFVDLLRAVADAASGASGPAGELTAGAEPGAEAVPPPDLKAPAGAELDGSGLWFLLMQALRETAPAAMPPDVWDETQIEPVEGAAPKENMPQTVLQLRELLEQLRQSFDGPAAADPAWMERSGGLLAESASRKAALQAETLPQAIQRLIQVLPERAAGVAGEPETTWAAADGGSAAAAGTEGLARFAESQTPEIGPLASFLSAGQDGVAGEQGRTRATGAERSAAATRAEGLVRLAGSQTPEAEPPAAFHSAGEAGTADEAQLKLAVRQNEAVTSNEPSQGDAGIPAPEKSLISERLTSKATAAPAYLSAHRPEQTGPEKTLLPDHSPAIGKLVADDHPEPIAEGGDSPAADHDSPVFKDLPPGAEFMLEPKSPAERFEMAARESRPVLPFEGQPESPGEAAVADRGRGASAGPLRTDVFDQIVQRAVLQVKNDSGEIRIDLKPDFLGQVRMQIVSENQQITVRILTELPVVRDMIETNLHQLKSELQSQGLQVQRVEVAVTDDPREHPWRQSWQGKPWKAAQAGGATLERPSPLEHTAIRYSGQRVGRLAAIDMFV